MPREIPGLFLDFDADLEKGEKGIPLCSSCFGTGIILENETFQEMSKEVSKF